MSSTDAPTLSPERREKLRAGLAAALGERPEAGALAEQARNLWAWSQQNAKPHGARSVLGSAFLRLVSLFQKPFAKEIVAPGALARPKNRPLWNPAKTAAAARGPNPQKTPKGAQTRDALARAARRAWLAGSAQADAQTLAAWFVALLNGGDAKGRAGAALDVCSHPRFDWHRRVKAREIGAHWALPLAGGERADKAAGAVTPAQAVASLLCAPGAWGHGPFRAAAQKPSSAAQNDAALALVAKTACALAEKWALRAVLAPRAGGPTPPEAESPSVSCALPSPSPRRNARRI